MTFIKIRDRRYGSRWVTPEWLAQERGGMTGSTRWTVSVGADGTRHWVRESPPARVLGLDCYPQTTPELDILDRIAAALAGVEHQRPEWDEPAEDDQGFVTWNGAPGAMSVLFADGKPPRVAPTRLGPRQADVLRYVYQRPGCSLNQAMADGGHYAYKGSGYMGAHTLEYRGLLNIDRSNPYRYALTITEAGIAALRARAARDGWVTGDPLPSR